MLISLDDTQSLVAGMSGEAHGSDVLHGVHGGSHNRACEQFFKDPSLANNLRASLLRLDLGTLRLAVLCADLGSLSIAVKYAHCSLSTGSYRLSALEDALGLQLFFRDHKGLRITESGAHVIERCRQILMHVAQLKPPFRADSTEKKSLHSGR